MHILKLNRKRTILLLLPLCNANCHAAVSYDGIQKHDYLALEFGKEQHDSLGQRGVFLCYSGIYTGPVQTLCYENTSKEIFFKLY